MTARGVCKKKYLVSIFCLFVACCIVRVFLISINDTLLQSGCYGHRSQPKHVLQSFFLELCHAGLSVTKGFLPNTSKVRRYFYIVLSQVWLKLVVALQRTFSTYFNNSGDYTTLPDRERRLLRLQGGTRIDDSRAKNLYECLKAGLARYRNLYPPSKK